MSNVNEHSDIVACEVCGLLHQRGVYRCDDCHHCLGQAPDWREVRGRRDALAREMGGAFALVAGMLALNLWLFGGVGYIVVLAPVVWLVKTAYRYRVLAKSVRRQEGSS